MKVLVTGSAGFIGMHVAERLLARGDEVVGFDNLSDYYDVNLKRARLARLLAHRRYTHVQADLADRGAVEAAFEAHRPQRVVQQPDAGAGDSTAQGRDGPPGQRAGLGRDDRRLGGAVGVDHVPAGRPACDQD